MFKETKRSPENKDIFQYCIRVSCVDRKQEPADLYEHIRTDISLPPKGKHTPRPDMGCCGIAGDR